MVLLSDLLSSVRVKVPLEATTKDALLGELVDVLVADRCVSDREPVLDVVRERERVLSTGVGHGVALPHGKTDACDRLLIAAGVTREPVDFDALDGAPVQLIFLLVGPESAAGAHVKALSRISKLVRQPEVRLRLMESKDRETFIETLREAEAG
ncbi:MAG: PTS transporter subunit EIIA [Gemmatimonadetes bacterium]|nr:PTS sugar transporter subunit IIA [Gemmatimonadota bacterium]NIQ58830.1 PTS sugar transporter subunit IIA [Gemmatimonadota bacterium]NIU78999.1 PTS transporter subunit EIIA [Gammaproteobacteria bacterium]NIX47743.1 PTS transporter subunit EIIA [Gemmatimonadota bacterium]NIY12104.1 PTS transporter subunit EIIA [Gemmatimonadota bacterium]